MGRGDDAAFIPEMHEVSPFARLPSDDSGAGDSAARMVRRPGETEESAVGLRPRAAVLFPGALFPAARPDASTRNAALWTRSISAESIAVGGRVEQRISTQLWIRFMGGLPGLDPGCSADVSAVPVVFTIEGAQERLVAQLFLMVG